MYKCKLYLICLAQKSSFSPTSYFFSPSHNSIFFNYIAMMPDRNNATILLKGRVY